MKLEEYLRNQYSNYIRPLYIKSYCESCGANDNLELHHIKQFSEILKETLEELNISYYDDIKAYTDNQIELINYVMLGKQLKADYVTLCNRCHMSEHNGKQNKIYYNIKRAEKKEQELKYIDTVIIPYLKSIVDNKLFKEDQQELIKVFDLKDSRNRLQKSPKLLNAYLEENKLQYVILNKQIRVDNKRKTVWTIATKN